MSIKQKIYDAVMRENARLSCQQDLSTPLAGALTYGKVNVLYLGSDQYTDLRCETGAINNVTRYGGMKVISVREESWLQGAYVEGVK